MMTFTKSNFVVVQPQGRLDEAGGTALQQALHRLCADHRSRWMLDLSQVDFIDHAGLRALVNSLQFAQQNQRHLVIHNPHPSVKLVLEITRYDDVFEIVETVESAPAIAPDLDRTESSEHSRGLDFNGAFAQPAA